MISLQHFTEDLFLSLLVIKRQTTYFHVMTELHLGGGGLVQASITAEMGLFCGAVTTLARF